MIMYRKHIHITTLMTGINKYYFLRESTLYFYVHNFMVYLQHVLKYYEKKTKMPFE